MILRGFIRMRLFSFDTDCIRRRSVLLAPGSVDPGEFTDIVVDFVSHESRLAEAQKLRGRIAVQEGAIDPTELVADGRHVQEADQHSWHLLTLDANGCVAACLRYHHHHEGAAFRDLAIARSPLARSKTWGGRLQAAVEADLCIARQRRCAYVELGGWVISEALRCTTEALRMIATAYAFAQLCGGALGISTASTQRCSSAILKRIGGQQLRSRGVDIPSFYDSQYRCHMEILRFDSSRSSPRYSRWMDACRSRLRDVPVICRAAGDASAMVNHVASSNIRLTAVTEMAR
ncbi:MAG: hypothetical protein ACLPWF_33290 [Bryobacteraceae bacterium]